MKIEGLDNISIYNNSRNITLFCSHTFRYSEITPTVPLLPEKHFLTNNSKQFGIQFAFLMPKSSSSSTYFAEFALNILASLIMKSNIYYIVFDLVYKLRSSAIAPTSQLLLLSKISLLYPIIILNRSFSLLILLSLFKISVISTKLL